MASSRHRRALWRQKGNLTGMRYEAAGSRADCSCPSRRPNFSGGWPASLERRAPTRWSRRSSAATTPADETAKSRHQVPENSSAHAGDSFIALSRGLTLADDRGQGEAMWKGVNLYDRAGAMPQSIVAMETFVAEQWLPDD